jgi:predicted CxxxxCH...CXXCH cytochrome family protein
LLAFCVIGCAKVRPIANDNRGCPTWQLGTLSNGQAPEIAPLFATNCVSCHSGAVPAAGYDLSSYLGVLGIPLPLDPNATNPNPFAIAGDPNSKLVTILQPATTDEIHAQFSSLAPTVSQWVVQCQLSFFNSAVHSSGILNPADPGFHGRLIADAGWDFPTCASCHGSDFSGGTSQVSCLTCHTSPGGPTSCNTCHGLPPANGAHFTHVDGGMLHRSFGCSECHVVPHAYTDPGHLFDADGGVLVGAPVVIFPDGGLADTPGFQRQGPPLFDPSSQTCSSVYCHGDIFGDSKATNTKPNWIDGGAGQASCGTCHGLPPSDHGNSPTQCSLCHGLVIDANRNFIDPSLHIDGMVSLGNGDGTCSACHGSSTNSAPPRDFDGNTDTTAIGVGAHQSHLQALNRLRGPIQCGDCHLVPQTPIDPGHLDHPPPAIVFPAAIAATSLAFVDDAGPIEDHLTATCSNVYCHGGGAQMQSDQSPNLNRKPIWNKVNGGQAACGTCHGIPPQDGTPGHDPGAGLGTCVSCHAGTVDAFGRIVITTLPDGGLTSLHIDGFIEVDGGIWSGP